MQDIKKAGGAATRDINYLTIAAIIGYGLCRAGAKVGTIIIIDIRGIIPQALSGGNLIFRG